MRPALTLLPLLLLAGSLALAGPQQSAPPQPPDPNVCAFTVHGDPAQPAITGPDNIVPLVYAVEQPDSPLEITAVDLSGMWLAIGNEQHQENSCGTYTVRNRSDRAVHSFDIELSVYTSYGAGGGGGGNSSPLAPGQSVTIRACNGGGRGGAPGNRVRLVLSIPLVDFGTCLYQPSLRLPRSLGVWPHAALHVWSESLRVNQP